MYYQVDGEFSHSIEIKRSEFITTLVAVTGADDADEKLKKIAKKYSDATHNCYAYIANDIATIMRFSDDGEPQGTAGIPMLEVLKRRNVIKTLAVVARYFGGVKLGAAGLVSAYTYAVSEAINCAKMLKFIESYNVKLRVDYNEFKGVTDIILSHDGKAYNIIYDTDITVECAVPTEVFESFAAKINDFTQGKVKVTGCSKEYFAY